MLIDTSELYRLRQAISDFLGKDFVAEMMQTRIDGFPVDADKPRDNREQVAEASRQKLNAHPLAKSLQDFEHDFSKSISTGKFHLRDSSVYLLEFAANLVQIGAATNAVILAGRLRQRNEFYATAYEIHIACKYLTLNYDVCFVPGEKGRDTPDLFVAKDGHTLQIECKSTEEDSAKQHNLFIQFAVRLDKAMEAAGVNLWIKLFPRIVLAGNHINELFAAVRDELTAANKKTQFLGGAVYVEWTIIDPTAALARTNNNDGQSVFDVARSIGERLDAGYLSMGNQRDTDGSFLWFLERATEIRNYVETDVFHAIKQKIRKANRQLTSYELPAVVHIRVGCSTPAALLKLLDANVERLQALIKGFRRVRAVVLDCLSIDYQLVEGGEAIAKLSYILSNPQSDLRIPRNLHLAGAVDTGLALDDRQGTAELILAKPPKPDVLFGRPLLVQSAPHGDEQLIVWVSDDSTVRCEVVSFETGRRIAECAVDWKSLPEEFQILATWDERALDLFVGAPKALDLENLATK